MERNGTRWGGYLDVLGWGGVALWGLGLPGLCSWCLRLSLDPLVLWVLTHGELGAKTKKLCDGLHHNKIMKNECMRTNNPVGRNPAVRDESTTYPWLVTRAICCFRRLLLLLGFLLFLLFLFRFLLFFLLALNRTVLKEGRYNKLHKLSLLFVNKLQKKSRSYFLYVLQPLIDFGKHPCVLPSLSLQLLPPLFLLILLLGLDIGWRWDGGWIILTGTMFSKKRNGNILIFNLVSCKFGAELILGTDTRIRCIFICQWHNVFSVLSA